MASVSHSLESIDLLQCFTEDDLLVWVLDMLFPFQMDHQMTQIWCKRLPESLWFTKVHLGSTRIIWATLAPEPSWASLDNPGPLFWSTLLVYPPGLHWIAIQRHAPYITYKVQTPHIPMGTSNWHFLIWILIARTPHSLSKSLHNIVGLH